MSDTIRSLWYFKCICDMSLFIPYNLNINFYKGQGSVQKYICIIYSRKKKEVTVPWHSSNWHNIFKYALFVDQLKVVEYNLYPCKPGSQFAISTDKASVRSGALPRFFNNNNSLQSAKKQSSFFLMDGHHRQLKGKHTIQTTRLVKPPPIIFSKIQVHSKSRCLFRKKSFDGPTQKGFKWTLNYNSAYVWVNISNGTNKKFNCKWSQESTQRYKNILDIWASYYFVNVKNCKHQASVCRSK